MTIQLPQLPYAENALEPYISAQTVSFHYTKHHAGYVEKTNELIAGKEYENMPLEELIKFAADSDMGILFDYAAQVWNHTFYWNSMTSADQPQSVPDSLRQLIDRDFGSVDALKAKMIRKSTTLFGSGYVWLVWENGRLDVVKTANAHTPLTSGTQVPLLCLDVWEHAYYLDEQNKRAQYAKNVMDNLINWSFAAENLSKI